MAGCVNRAQMLEALEVLTAIIERDKLPVGRFEWLRAARETQAMTEAYRARWGQ